MGPIPGGQQQLEQVERQRRAARERFLQAAQRAGLQGVGVRDGQIAFGNNLQQGGQATGTWTVNNAEMQAADDIIRNARLANEGRLNELREARVNQTRTEQQLVRDLTEAERSRLGVLRSQAESVREANERRMQDVSGRGFMTRGQYRQAQRAWERIERLGGIELASEQTVQQAMRLNPRFMQQQINELNERRIHSEVDLRMPHVDSVMRRDWEGGMTLERGFRAQDELEAVLRERADRVMVDFAERMTRAREEELRMMADIAIASSQQAARAVRDEILARIAQGG
jgi:hypothetical protein